MRSRSSRRSAAWSAGSPCVALLAIFAASCEDANPPVAPLPNTPRAVIAAAGPGTWTTKAPMPTARCCLAVGVVNGVLYAVGGYWGNLHGDGTLATVEAYDPASNTWTTKAPMPTARSDFAIGVVNGILYAVGGNGGTVDAYDPATNSWTTKAPMPTARLQLAIGVVNGILYAVGGYTGTNYVATVEAYDPRTNTWTTKAPMPTVDAGLAIGVVNGILYAVGSGPTVNAYDPATNAWTAKSPMPTARNNLAAGVANGILYAVGGQTATDYVATVEAYDPGTNTWTTAPSMPTARTQLAADVLSNSVYVVGGRDRSGTPVATVEAYTPSSFAVPDLLNNASFETGWDGFINWSFGTPSPATGPFSISRSQDVAYDGVWSAKSTFGPNGADTSVQFAYPFAPQLRVSARVWFYLTGALPTNHRKWIRFREENFGLVLGGLYLSSPTGGVTWVHAENSQIDVDLGIGIPTFNAWHSIEVEYDRTAWNDTTRGPRARFWYDGAPAVGPSPTQWFGNPGTAYWGDEAGTVNPAGPWLYAGARSGAAVPSAILVFDDNLNGPNSASGATYYDRIAVSTQRIGP